MNEVPTKRNWEPTPRVGKRFIVSGTDYIPEIVLFTAFDKTFLRSCGWSATVVKS
jgi:hypothetical protein